MISSDNPPVRISRSARIELNGPIERVFLLFSPQMEKFWAAGWEFKPVFPSSGELEQHMVFSTPPFAQVDQNEGDYLWTVSAYEPDTCFVEYTVFTAARIWVISVQCNKLNENTSRAEISYTYTALSETGERLNTAAVKAMFSEGLKDWEREINDYLSHNPT